MIAESRPPTFGSFGPKNYVQSNSNTLSTHLTFMFDNCASVSATNHHPSKTNLINYRTCPHITLGRFGGTTVEELL